MRMSALAVALLCFGAPAVAQKAPIPVPNAPASVDDGKGSKAMMKGKPAAKAQSKASSVSGDEPGSQKGVPVVKKSDTGGGKSDGKKQK